MKDKLDYNDFISTYFSDVDLNLNKIESECSTLIAKINHQRQSETTDSININTVSNVSIYINCGNKNGSHIGWQLYYDKISEFIRAELNYVYCKGLIISISNYNDVFLPTNEDIENLSKELCEKLISNRDKIKKAAVALIEACLIKETILDNEVDKHCPEREWLKEMINKLFKDYKKMIEYKCSNLITRKEEENKKYKRSLFISCGALLISFISLLKSIF